MKTLLAFRWATLRRSRFPLSSSICKPQNSYTNMIYVELMVFLICSFHVSFVCPEPCFENSFVGFLAAICIVTIPPHEVATSSTSTLRCLRHEKVISMLGVVFMASHSTLIRIDILYQYLFTYKCSVFIDLRTILIIVIIYTYIDM